MHPQDDLEHETPTPATEAQGAEKQEKPGEKLTKKQQLVARIKKNAAIFVLLLALLIGAVYFAAQFGLGSFALKKAVNYWIEAQVQQAKTEGTEIDISYSDILFEGGLSDRYVVIKNPRIRVAPKGLSLKLAGDEVSQFATARIILYPEDRTLENMRVELPEAIDVYSQGSLVPTFSVKPKTPLLVALSAEETQGQLFRVIHHYLPVQWHITYHQTAGEQVDEDAPKLPDTRYFEITLDEGGQYYSRYVDGGYLGEVKFHFDHLNIQETTDNQAIFKMAIESFAANWKGVADEENKILQTVQLNLNNLTAADGEDLAPYSPISAVARLGLNETPLSEEKLANAAKGVTHEGVLVIEQLALSSNTSKFQAKGAFNADADDVIPYGNAVVSLDNVEGFLQHLENDDVLNQKEHALAQEVADAIIGEKADMTAGLNFVVAREKGSNFLIGKTTVEALLSTALRAALGGATIAPGGSSDEYDFNDLSEEDQKRILQQIETQHPAQ